MSEWINPEEEQPKESGWYLVAFHSDSSYPEMFPEGYWTHQVIQYCAETQGWNTFVGDSNRRNHEMFPDFWMPIPDMPVWKEVS